MKGDSRMELSITILLTGFVVVFAVLLVLIGVIKLYGTIIYNLQNKNRAKAKKKVVVEKVEPPVPAAPQPADVFQPEEEEDDALIAVISAAVYSVMSSDKVRIRSIRRAPAGRSAWRAAGLSDNTRAF